MGTLGELLAGGALALPAGLLVAGAACFLAMAQGFARVGFPASRVRRALAAAVLGGVVLGLCLAAEPGLLSGAGDAWAWLAKREVFQASVAESQPLLIGAQGFETAAAVQLFSRLLYALPLLLALLVAGAERADGAGRGAPAAWASIAFAAALLQRRFVNEFVVSRSGSLLRGRCAAQRETRAAGRGGSRREAWHARLSP